jgi:hypothetical protein
MIELNSDQWELYLKKYSKLMWKISHRISGDCMLASLEDNYSDLSIAAIESINGFHKKTGKTFDEMIGMKLFDQYTKTCLWTAKARKGIKLTERMPFRNRHVSIDELWDEDGTSFDIPDTSSLSKYSRSAEAREVLDNLPKDLKKAASLLESDPSLFTEAGFIKLTSLATKMGMSPTKVKSLLNLMEKRNEYESN